MNKKVWDFAKICHAEPYEILKPGSIEDVISIIKRNNEKTERKKICIAGGKFSHGGQTMLDNSIYIDTINLNKIKKIGSKLVCVESGVIWNDLIKFLDNFQLSVAEMQSYANFSIGGSISVNCHGRGNKYGTLSDTIVSMKIIDYSGKLIKCSRRKNCNLFKAIIGGYGGIGVIVSATLIVVNNCKIIRKVVTTPTNMLITELNKNVNDKKLEFYNATIYPNNENEIVHVSFLRTNRPITINENLHPKKKSF